MSARFFPNALQNFASADLDWDADTIRAKLLKLDGTVTDTAIKAITGATNADPVVYTIDSTSGWTTGDIVVVRGIVGNLTANQTGILEVVDGTTFRINLLDGGGDYVAASGAYSSGGCVINLTLADTREDIDGAEVGGLSDALGSKTNTDGVLDAADPTSMTLDDTAHAMFLYQDTASAATDINVHFQDGKQTVVAAAPASSSATTIYVEALAGPIDDNEVLYFSDGTSATVDGAVSQGARSITVDALAANLALGAQADVRTTNSGFPISSGGGPVAPTFDNGANKIGRI